MVERGHGVQAREGWGQVTVGSVAAARRSKPRARGAHGKKWPWRSTCGAASRGRAARPSNVAAATVGMRRTYEQRLASGARLRALLSLHFQSYAVLKIDDLNASAEKITHPSIPKTPPPIPGRNRSSENESTGITWPKERLEAPALHERRAHKAACKDTTTAARARGGSPRGHSSDERAACPPSPPRPTFYMNQYQ